MHSEQDSDHSKLDVDFRVLTPITDGVGNVLDLRVIRYSSPVLRRLDSEDLVDEVISGQFCQCKR